MLSFSFLFFNRILTYLQRGVVDWAKEKAGAAADWVKDKAGKVKDWACDKLQGVSRYADNFCEN